MDSKTTRAFFLWCAILNYAVLLVWFWGYVLLRESLIRLWSKWIPLSAEQFDLLNFAGIMLFKILILVFNLTPLIALLILGRANKERS